MPDHRTRARLVAHFFREQNGLCIYCGVQMHLGPAYNKTRATFEHKNPRTLGGKAHISNGAASCRRCNGAKSEFTHEEFVRVLENCGGIEGYLKLAARAQTIMQSIRDKRRAQKVREASPYLFVANPNNPHDGEMK